MVRVLEGRPVWRAQRLTATEYSGVGETVSTRSTWSIVPRFNRDLLLWLLSWGLSAFGYFGLQAVLFNLYLLRLGFGTEFIGLLVGGGQLVWAIAALPAAAVGRRVGLRTAMVCGYAFGTVGLGLMLFAESLPRPLWEPCLFGSSAVFWIGAALVTVNNIPYALAIVDEAGRAAVFPMQQAVQAVSVFAGSLAGGILPGVVVGWTGESLADPGPYRTVLWIVPVLFLACVPILARARQASLVGTGLDEARKTKIPVGAFVMFGSIVLLGTAAEGPMRAFFNLYLDRGLGIPTAQIGLILGGAQLLPVVTAVLTVRLLTRFGAVLTLSMGNIGVSAACLFLSGAAAVGTAAVGYVVVMMLLAVNQPARNVFGQEVVEARWRTTTSAIQTIGTALGWASTAVVGGFLIARFGFSGVFALSALCAAAAAVLAYGYARARSSRLGVARPAEAESV